MVLLRIVIAVAKIFTTSNRAFKICLSIGLLAWLTPKFIYFNRIQNENDGNNQSLCTDANDPPLPPPTSPSPSSPTP